MVTDYKSVSPLNVVWNKRESGTGALTSNNMNNTASESLHDVERLVCSECWLSLQCKLRLRTTLWQNCVQWPKARLHDKYTPGNLKENEGELYI